MTSNPTEEVKVGGVVVQKASGSVERISGLLWGPAGCGKTTLACTAPGRKLILNFDPDGPTSVAYRDDVDVVDLSDMSVSLAAEAKKDNPFGIGAALEAYDTLVVDSLTNFGHKALMQGIAVSKGATIELPSLQGYGVRTALTVQLVKNLLILTKKKGKNIFFIAHEAQPQTNEEGHVMAITVALGGQLPTQVPLDLSEVWYVNDTGKERRIMVRPGRQRKPMKTRMFSTTGDIEFTWKYNSDTGEGEGIEHWFKKWVEGGRAKLPLPK